MTDTTGIFIVGAPRSGTTLLQSIIATHSEFYSLPETSFFNTILPILGLHYFNPETPIDQHAMDTIKYNFKTMTGVTINDDCAMQTGMPVKEAFESLLSCFNTESKPRWVEKTTNHAGSMLAIKRFYPDARFINIIRDPVDAIASMKHIKPVSIEDFRVNYISSYHGHAQIWRNCVTSALHYPAQGNVLHVFFEELIINPKKVINNVCRFLEISFEISMIESFHSMAKSLFSQQHSPWQSATLNPGLHTEAVFKWRKRLPRSTVWLIQHYTEDLARYLGYYEEMGPVPLLIKLPRLIFDKSIRLISASGIERWSRKLLGGSKK